MDKVFHCLAYFIISTLGMLGMPGLSNRPKIVAALIGWGVLVEFLQIPVGRSFEFADMLANSLGVGLGLALLTLTGLGRNPGPPAPSTDASSSSPSVT